MKSDENLDFANCFFVEKTYPIKDEFIHTLQKHYNSEAQNLDFKNDPKKSRKAINSSVKEVTRGKIRKILPKSRVDRNTKVVLVSALRFKGEWVSKFEKAKTEKMDFRGPDGTVPVDMMFRKGQFSVMRTDFLKSTVLELPYQGERTSMLLFLPFKWEDFGVLEERISKLYMGNFEMDDKLTGSLYLPRFKLTSSWSLQDNLKSAGMEELFTKNADFSRLTDSSDICVSEILQKVTVEVDEDGATVEAATACKAITKSRSEEWKFDRPFFFMIQNRETKMVLLTGKVTNPTKH